MNVLRFFPPCVLAQLKGCSSWFHRGYLFDWVASLLVFVVFEAVSMFVNPFDRYLPPNDANVQFPKHDDIVSSKLLQLLFLYIVDTLLMILAVVFPLVVFMLAQVYHACTIVFAYTL